MTNSVQLNFVKMSGAGNDFVLINNQAMKYQLDWSALARTLCSRRFGVGADGLLIIEKGITVPYKMLYYNADGSYGGMCGNGGRCVGEFLMKRLGTHVVLFEALDYVYRTELKYYNHVSLQMKNPTDFKTNIVVSVNSNQLKGYFINTGAPHAIFFLNDLPHSIKDSFHYGGVVSLGKTIRYHETFQPDGTNVDFITISGENQLSMRTYERGVEDETLACGTGAVACAAISSLTLNFQPPITVRTKGGESLIVNFERVGETISNVTLTGSATEIFEGTVNVDLAENKIVNL
jgi:diaminopimelate epimerase